MIHPVHFHDLLECLAGQFFTTRTAMCVDKDFGIHLSLNAKKYFSIAIIQEELPRNLAVRGVLTDDAIHIASRNGFTFTIYIDPAKFDTELFEVFSTAIIAHEICHFASYYEIFFELGDNVGSNTHNYFKNIVSYELLEAIRDGDDSTSQTPFDGHDIIDLISNLRKFPKEHFSRNRKSVIDYQKFLDSFLEHLKLDEKIANYNNLK